MSFLTIEQEKEIQSKLITDEVVLRKEYKVRKNEYHMSSVKQSLVDDLEKDGWEIEKVLKSKTRLKKIKKFSEKFEDDIWCQFYELGYRCLNRDELFYLPFDKELNSTKQIDVVAINDETVFLVECKSSNNTKTPQYKDEFDLLKLRINGFKKSIEQIFGKNIKVKHIFATRNLRIDKDSIHMQRLKNANSFYYNDNTYKYINGLIKNYKEAALFQFLALTLKGFKINDDKVKIPAIEGNMGGKKYYMFSIEPNLLLKMGFVLHRVRANEAELPTYQRLLQPNRLTGIRKFIAGGGYFPNSIIINFNTKKIEFESASKLDASNSRFGTLKLPNSYSIAYIIDGQHRLYGYAGSKYAKTNTVPVVAFHNMPTEDQLQIFMDINENQKAVSPSLKLDLEEDLHWGSDRADSRLKALRSSIIKELSNNTSSPLYNKIDVGEDKAILKFKPFVTALQQSGLLPSARGNQYIKETVDTSLYDTNNHNYNQEMLRTKKKIVQLIILCYEFIEQQYHDIYTTESKENLILSNRGTYPFIVLIGKLNIFLTKNNTLTFESSPKERFEKIERYLDALLLGVRNLSNDSKKEILAMYGSDIKWLRYFQSIVNKVFPEYNPLDLVEWNEREDEELQSKGVKYSDAIELYMKNTVINILKKLYTNTWEVKITEIKIKCSERALKEQHHNDKNNLGSEDIDWTEMFYITDYKAIIEKHWSKQPQIADANFRSFQEVFAYRSDLNEDFNSKSDKIKWILTFNQYRNKRTHSATKGKKLNKKEIQFLQNIYNHFQLYNG